jgi:hypothetical protein
MNGLAFNSVLSDNGEPQNKGKAMTDTPESFDAHSLENLNNAMPIMLGELINLSSSGDLDRAGQVQETISALFGEVIEIAIAGMETSGR